MTKPRFIIALGMPLDENDHLHRQGLAAQIEDQHQAGIDAL